MSPRRFAARHGAADATQPAIVAALRRCGASVMDTHAIGGGFPDLIVGYHGQDYKLEVKTEKGQLRESQAHFAETWRGSPVLVVRSPAEALRAIGIRLDT